MNERALSEVPEGSGYFFRTDDLFFYWIQLHCLRFNRLLILK